MRGGDSYEVGYEFDGIPVNRAFDNYPSGSLSSLGQLELQVYTGATPSNAEAQGLAGFINQVIKTGTFPGYANINPTVGTPTFYHSLNVEAGGSTPDRLFSYYVGIGGYNQDHRYVDQFGGAAYTNEFGQQLGSCPATPTKSLPSCYTNGQPNVGPGGTPGSSWVLGPIGFGTLNPANIATRTSLVNVHIGNSAQERRAARRHPASVRQRRNLHDVLKLGQRRRAQQLARNRRLAAVLPGRLSVQGQDRRAASRQLRVARKAVRLSRRRRRTRSSAPFPIRTINATAATTARRFSNCNIKRTSARARTCASTDTRIIRTGSRTVR